MALDSGTVVLLIAGFSQSKELWRQVLHVEASDRLGRLAGRRECHTERCIDLKPFIVIVELVDHAEEKQWLTDDDGAVRIVRRVGGCRYDVWRFSAWARGSEQVGGDTAAKGLGRNNSVDDRRTRSSRRFGGRIPVTGGFCKLGGKIFGSRFLFPCFLILLSISFFISTDVRYSRAGVQ